MLGSSTICSPPRACMAASTAYWLPPATAEPRRDEAMPRGAKKDVAQNARGQEEEGQDRHASARHASEGGIFPIKLLLPHAGALFGSLAPDGALACAKMCW